MFPLCDIVLHFAPHFCTFHAFQDLNHQFWQLEAVGALPFPAAGMRESGKSRFPPKSSIFLPKERPGPRAVTEGADARAAVRSRGIPGFPNLSGLIQPGGIPESGVLQRVGEAGGQGTLGILGSGTRGKWECCGGVTMPQRDNATSQTDPRQAGSHFSLPHLQNRNFWI